MAMTDAPRPAATAGSRRVLEPALELGLMALLGLLAGALIWLATDLVSKSDIGGPGWSLRGNGALIVPFAAGPALLAGGWTGLVLWRRRERRWVEGAALAGTLAAAAGLGGALLPAVLLGLVQPTPEGPELGGPASVLMLASSVAPPLVALLTGAWLADRYARPVRRRLAPSAAVCIAVAIVSWLAGAFLMPLLLPLAILIPLLASAPPAPARHGPAWLAAGLVVLPLSLAAGIFATASLASGIGVGTG
jgi:hypothetical protein